MPPEAYKSNLFINERQSVIQDLREWVGDDTDVKRLRLIVAPPDYGKTWLLHKLKDDLQTTGVAVLLLSAQDLTANPTEKLKDAIAKNIPHITPIQNEASLESILKQLHIDLHPDRRFVVLVDGLNEPAIEIQKIIQKNLLEPLLRYPKNSKIIITTRDDYSLSSALLRRREGDRIPLNLFSPDSGWKQLQKRAKYGNDDDRVRLPDDFVEQVQPYDLSIPGLNTCLFEKLRQKQESAQPAAFNTADFEDCIRQALQVSNTILRHDINELLADMQTLVKARLFEWTLEKFSATCKYDRQNTIHHRNDLIVLGVVDHISTDRWKFDLGWYKFIQRTL